MDWITINKTEGRGSAEVKVTAPTYRELVDRMTRLKISTLSKTAYVSITQEKFIPIFELSKTNLVFINDVFEEGVNITSNIEWTATVSNDWITLSSYSGDGNSVLTISVGESDSNERTGSVEFYNSGVLIGTISVTQYDNSFGVIYVEPAEIDLTDNLTATISVFSNMEWTANTNVDWITITPNEGVAGNEMQVIITAEEYIEDREGIISFYIDGTKKNEVIVYQTRISETQFYIEAVDEITLQGTYYDTAEGKDVDMVYTTFSYIIEGETRRWRKTKYRDADIITLKPNQKIYIKDISWREYMLNSRSRLNISGRFNVGGDLVDSLETVGTDHFFRETEVVDASNLILNNKGNYGFSFYGTFYGCVKLEYAPKKITGTDVRYNFLNFTFCNCINLKTAPVIYLNSYVYSGADNNTVSGKYYKWGRNMFEGCNELKLVKIFINEVEENARGFFESLPENCILIANFDVNKYYLDSQRNYLFGSKFYPCNTLFIDENPSSLVPISFLDLTDDETFIIPLLDNDVWITQPNWVNIEKDNNKLIISRKYNFISEVEDYIRIYNKDNELVNTILVSQVPEPIEDCFYISPVPFGSNCWITHNSSISTGAVTNETITYYYNNEWNTINFLSLDLEINKRIYFRDYIRTSNSSNFNFFHLEYCNVGGNIETLLGEMREDYAIGLFINGDILDASNLILPATTLQVSCYQSLFSGCYFLRKITMLATDISAGWSLYYWVNDVSPTGIFYKNPNMDISNFSRGINGIPEGWEVRDADL